MKKVILLFLVLPLQVFSQISENFESGDLNKWIQSVDGNWKADTTASISGSWSLHHSFDNPKAGNDQIGIPVTDLQPTMGPVKWSFKIRHGYDPSASNNWGVFLLSDSGPDAMIPDGKINGFAIGVNLTGYDDTLYLWKFKGGVASLVLNTGINWQNNIGITKAAAITVERSAAGEWKISVNKTDGSFFKSANGMDAEVFRSEWFGVYYKYSSTCDRLLWLDDIGIDGTFSKDIDAPLVTGCIAAGRNSVEVTFNEEPENTVLVPRNFSINGSNEKAKNVIRKSRSSIQIEFENLFINKSVNNLMIDLLCDYAGNCSENINIPFTIAWAEPGDIVISEIMADPEPSVLLPEKEYIELTNRTVFPLELKGWQLSSESQKIILPEKVIRPGDYIIVCSVPDTSAFSHYGNVLGLKSFPTLTDNGKLIWLSDSSGNMIHGVEYSAEWYGDNLKAEGGWSLEMIDPGFPFFGDGNWKASVSGTGGTPGRKNSVSHDNPDKSFSGITNVFPADSANVIISFSEPVRNIPGISGKIKLNSKDIMSVYPTDPLFREFCIKPDGPLIRGQVYTIIIPGDAEDFAGNRVQKGNFEFGLPETAFKRELVFNELMFNPLPGNADYIEFYNNSGKVFDATRMYLVSLNDATGDTSELIPVSKTKRCILPRNYYAITTDDDAVTSQYISSDSDHIFETSLLPAMSDDKGHLILLNRQLEIIDEVFYDEKMHYSLLASFEGIALEKIRPEEISADRKNWHSASEASGWGTPGATNSIYMETPVSEDNVILSSRKITPDNDGYEDLLVLDFYLKGTRNIISVMVFNETGGYVRKLADNLLAGSKASVAWDGTADDGSLVRTGIYIIYISIFDDTGKTLNWKKVCTVIRK
jgi:hypothetical protein